MKTDKIIPPLGSNSKDSMAVDSKSLPTGTTNPKKVNDPANPKRNLRILGKGSSIGSNHCRRNVATHLPTSDPSEIVSGNASSAGFKFALPSVTRNHYNIRLTLVKNRTRHFGSPSASRRSTA